MTNSKNPKTQSNNWWAFTGIKTLPWGFFAFGFLFASADAGAAPAARAAGTDPEKTPKTKILQKITVALDWTPNTNHAGLYIAKAKGYFKANGLEVKFVQPNQTNTMQVVAAERAQFGISFTSDVLNARSQNILVTSIAAIIQENTSCFAWRTGVKIQTVNDWEGKRYGGWGSPEEEQTLKHLMEKNGANFGKLKIVTTGVSDFLPTTEKTADFMWIYMGWDGIRAKLANIAVSTLCAKDLEPALNHHSPLIIASDALLNRQPQLAKDFLKAARAGYEVAINNPVEAAKFLLQEVPELDPKLVQESALYLADKYQGQAKSWGLQSNTVWQRFLDWSKQRKLVQKPEQATSYYSNRFLPAQEK